LLHKRLLGVKAPKSGNFIRVHPVWVSVDLVNKVPGVEETDPTILLSLESLFPKIWIRRYFRLRLKHIIVAIQRTNDSIEEIVHSNFIDMLIPTVAKFISCTSQKTVDVSLTTKLIQNVKPVV